MLTENLHRNCQNTYVEKWINDLHFGDEHAGMYCMCHSMNNNMNNCHQRQSKVCVI